jgi:hypothetical protein
MISALGPTALRARNPTSFDCIFMSVSVRDLSPEMPVLVLPGYVGLRRRDGEPENAACRNQGSRSH